MDTFASISLQFPVYAQVWDEANKRALELAQEPGESSVVTLSFHRSAVPLFSQVVSSSIHSITQISGESGRERLLSHFIITHTQGGPLHSDR